MEEDLARGGGTGGEPWNDAARCIRSYSFALSGDSGRALDLFGDLPGPATAVPAGRTDVLTYRGIARLSAGDLHAAAADLAVAVHRIRAGLQVRFPEPPLAFLAEAEFRLGRWDDAQGHAELTVSLTRDADRDYHLAFLHSLAVPVAACRGDSAAATALAQAAEQASGIFGGLASISPPSPRATLRFTTGEPHTQLRRP